MANITVSNSGNASNALSFTILPPIPPGVGVVQVVSAAQDGSPSNGNTVVSPAISANGRYVVFQSDATNLVPGPSSGFSDIFVRDTCIGAVAGCVPNTVRVSVADDGTLPNGNSRGGSISADGRYVAFDSSATTLVPNDQQIGSMADIFIRDTCAGAGPGCTSKIWRASLRPDGGQATGDSRNPSLSADARYVAFNSTANDLVSGDGGNIDVFVHDNCINAPAPCAPATSLVSLASSGTKGNDDSFYQSISADGRFIVFFSDATNLAPNDTNNQRDVFVRDTCNGASGCTPSTTRVSIATDGTQGNMPLFDFPAISGNGRAIAFTSFANNLVPNDTNGFGDAFLRDTCFGAPGCSPSLSRISVTAAGQQANEGSHQPSLDFGGRFVAFASLASNLTPQGTSAPESIFVRDTCLGAAPGCIPNTIILSQDQSGHQGNGVSIYPVLSADAHYVVFVSTSTNLGSNPAGLSQVFIAKTGY